MKTFLLICLCIVATIACQGAEAELKLLQIIDPHAALCTGLVARGDGTWLRLQQPIVLYVQTKGLADGDPVNANLFPVGVHQFNSIFGLKTFRSYTTQAEAAAKLIAAGVDQQQAH